MEDAAGKKGKKAFSKHVVRGVCVFVLNEGLFLEVQCRNCGVVWRHAHFEDEHFAFLLRDCEEIQKWKGEIVERRWRFIGNRRG